MDQIDWVMRNGIIFLFSLCMWFQLTACSIRKDESLVVRHYHLKSTELVDRDARMIRGEQMYRLRGALTLEERRSRLGHYYTFVWDVEGATELIFEYQQAATTTKEKIVRVQLDPRGKGRKKEIAIIGDDYLLGGRVLAWRARLLSGGRELAEQKSYMWQ